MLWSLVVHSPSLRIFQEATHFAVNVLARDRRPWRWGFAKSSPDKFAGVAWRPGCGFAPVLEGVAATFECRNSYRYYGGDHVIFMGEVEHTRDATTRAAAVRQGPLRRLRTAGVTAVTAVLDPGLRSRASDALRPRNDGPTSSRGRRSSSPRKASRAARASSLHGWA